MVNLDGMFARYTSPKRECRIIDRTIPRKDLPIWNEHIVQFGTPCGLDKAR